TCFVLESRLTLVDESSLSHRSCQWLWARIFWTASLEISHISREFALLVDSRLIAVGINGPVHAWSCDINLIARAVRSAALRSVPELVRTPFGRSEFLLCFH